MKKVLLVVLTMVFTLSLASMALAANTSPDSTTANSTTTYGTNYPLPYGVPNGDLTKSAFATNDSSFDNGLVNANRTGAGVGTQDSIGVNAIKNVAGQRTHGEYASNTNSCASCHQVHTAAGDNLLFKDDVFYTCTACHDGTLGVYNVFQGSTAGTFGGTADGHASMHLPTGVMDTKAAPGGNHNPTSATSPWEGEFNCASCHSPHGSYSDRLLNYNPNRIASTPMFFTSTDGVSYVDKDGNSSLTPVPSGGTQVYNATVIDGVPQTVDATSPDYIVVRTTSDDINLNVKVNQVASGTKVIVLMKKVQNSTKTGYLYQRDITPWINDHAGPSAYGENWTKFSTNNSVDTKPVLDATKINFSLGYAYAYGSEVNNIQKAQISRAVIVKLGFTTDSTVTNGNVMFNGNRVRQVDVNTYDAKISGVTGANQISTFCASCHTDYLATADAPSGVWSTAFRHNTKSDTYTCLKCHFAHGTDVNVMLDAKDKSLSDKKAEFEADTAKYTTTTAADQAALDYMLDRNSSSALKRYTNMSVCWKCHTSSHSGDIVNNLYVQGGVNSGVTTSSEFVTTGDSLPNGWAALNNASLPYAR